MIHWLASLLMFFGRILLGAIFLWSSFDKVVNFTGYTELVVPEGLTHVNLYLTGSIIVELLGGVSLVFGIWTRFGAALLLIYMVPATLIFHDFWIINEPVEKHLQTILFLKNLAICGGLLYVLSCGPGLLSYKRHKKEHISSDE